MPLPRAPRVTASRGRERVDPGPEELVQELEVLEGVGLAVVGREAMDQVLGEQVAA